MKRECGLSGGVVRAQQPLCGLGPGPARGRGPRGFGVGQRGG